MKRFEVVRELGNGAFGIVLECRDRETGELVAIKKMKARSSSFTECLDLKEVKSLRHLKHPNVVRLIQLFRENDHLFLVFELLGHSLLNTIKDQDGPFDEAEIRYIAHQIFTGLNYIHSNKYFHRDIKPENLLWKDEVLKLADFGLAREIRSVPPYTQYISTRWYRAPELVLRASAYNSPVDIWAVGAIMAELYLKRPIFQGSTETDQLFKICSVLGSPTSENWSDGIKLASQLGLKLPHFSPTPLSSLIPQASKEAIDLLYDIFNYDPVKRPSAAKALEHPFFSKEMYPPRTIRGRASAEERVPSPTPVVDFQEPVEIRVNTYEQESAVRVPSYSTMEDLPQIDEPEPLDDSFLDDLIS